MDEDSAIIDSGVRLEEPIQTGSSVSEPDKRSDDVTGRVEPPSRVSAREQADRRVETRLTQGIEDLSLYQRSQVDYRPVNAPVEERNNAPVEERNGAPVEERNVAPVEERNGAPVEGRNGAPVEGRNGAPVEGRNGAPVEERNDAPVEERNGALPPQRSVSDSSTESDEQLQLQLESTHSDAERCNVYKRYSRELRKKNHALQTYYEELLQRATEERDKLSALLDSAQTERSLREHSLKDQIDDLQERITILQNALVYARRGAAIPDDIHQQLVQLDCSEVLAETGTPVSSQGPICPFSSLNNHEFLRLWITNSIQTRGTQCLGCIRKIQRIDSHPYGKAILIATAAFALQKDKKEVEGMKLFWRGDLVKKGPAVNADDCKYPCKREAFCGQCDNSTSAWENEFSKQFKTGTIQFRGDDITKALLLVQMFRGGLMSIDIHHYMECQHCGPYLKDVGANMLELQRFHEAVCQRSDEIAEKCQQLKPVVLHSTTFGGRILFPMVVFVNGFGPILYAQIPPYFWAIPAPSFQGELSLPVFISVVGEIARVCSEEETKFFQREAAADQWRGTIPQPVLIFPLFDLKCCLKVF